MRVSYDSAHAHPQSKPERALGVTARTQLSDTHTHIDSRDCTLSYVEFELNKYEQLEVNESLTTNAEHLAERLDQALEGGHKKDDTNEYFEKVLVFTARGIELGRQHEAHSRYGVSRLFPDTALDNEHLEVRHCDRGRRHLHLQLDNYA